MSDLPVETVPGQEYGKQAEQQRAQAMVPMGQQPQLQPRSLPTPLTAPSARPNEPVQAGLPSGPGPGPEALGAMNGAELTRATLQALIRRYPSPTLERMLLNLRDS